MESSARRIVFVMLLTLSCTMKCLNTTAQPTITTTTITTQPTQPTTTRQPTQLTTTTTTTTTSTTITTYSITNNNNNNDDNTNNIKCIMYPLEPFAYKSQGHHRGIINVMFTIAENKCGGKVDVDYIDLKDRRTFIDTIHNAGKYPYGAGDLANVSDQDSVIWVPYDYDLKLADTTFHLERDIENIQILSSKKIVIVMPQHQISLAKKLGRGIMNCGIPLTLCILTTFVIGIYFWILERPFNEELSNPVTGPGTAIYWSFVTMTTVGYGDVAPKNFFGRSLAVVWMFLGMIISSILTATLSESTSGIEGLQIAEKLVAVLENSYEKGFVKTDYKGIPISFASYDEMIKAVREEKVFAAALPYEVASQMQESIVNRTMENVLSIVYSLYGSARYFIFVSKEYSQSSNGRCMFDSQRIAEAAEYFERKITFQTLYHGSLEVQMVESFLFLFLYVLLGAGILLGILLVFVLPKGKCQKMKTGKSEVASFASVEQKIDEKIGELSKLIDTLNNIKKNGSYNNNGDSQGRKKNQPGNEFLF